MEKLWYVLEVEKSEEKEMELKYELTEQVNRFSILFNTSTSHKQTNYNHMGAILICLWDRG